MAFIKPIKLFVAFAVSCSLFAGVLSHASESPIKRIKVFQAGKNVSAPELMPIDLSKLFETNCINRMSGDVELATIVDPEGSPNDTMPLQTSGDNLGRLALDIASQDKFKAGHKDGVPVAVSITINMHLDVCIATVADAKGKPAPKVRLLSQPVQSLGPASNQEPSSLILDPPETAETGDLSAPFKIGGDVKPPYPIKTPPSEFSEEVLRKGIQSICLISLIVDAQGIPHHPEVTRPIGYGLDAKALEEVKAYRFKPATKNGQPVPVKLSIEMGFRLAQ
ncbi:MAG TPA: energy transducer TonB [Terracidiphilus sp.]|jgi:outer membrane biosynthesis protein TonB